MVRIVASWHCGIETLTLHCQYSGTTGNTSTFGLSDDQSAGKVFFLTIADVVTMLLSLSSAMYDNWAQLV